MALSTFQRNLLWHSCSYLRYFACCFCSSIRPRSLSSHPPYSLASSIGHFIFALYSKFPLWLFCTALITPSNTSWQPISHVTYFIRVWIPASSLQNRRYSSVARIHSMTIEAPITKVCYWKISTINVGVSNIFTIFKFNFVFYIWLKLSQDNALESQSLQRRFKTRKALRA